MGIRLLSTAICAVIVFMMVMDCSSGAGAPATTAATAAVPETVVKDTTAGDMEVVKADWAVDYSDVTVEIMAKGLQYDFWKAVKMGSEQAAEDLGLKSTNFVGPANESAVAEQIEQLNNAVNKAPSAICLAALDTQASLDAIPNAQVANIPIIGFDSGVPDTPADSIVANAATDNYVAGGLAAEKLYEMIKGKVIDPAEEVRIGIVSQDATSQSIGEQTGGFTDKMRTLVGEDKCMAVGHDKYSKAVGRAKVIINVGIPATADNVACATVANTLLNKNDLVTIYTSNEFTAKNLVTVNESLQVLGVDKVIGVGSDSGVIQFGAIKSGVLAGSITRNPVQIGYQVVTLAAKAAKGEPVEDADTGALWYDSTNMDSAEIAPCLYEWNCISQLFNHKLIRRLAVSFGI